MSCLDWHRLYELIFRTDQLAIEDDSSIFIDWIRPYVKGAATHPLVWDIIFLLKGVALLVIRHIYHEANFAVDWIASFVAQHSGDVI